MMKHTLASGVKDKATGLCWASSVNCGLSRVMNISYGLVAKSLKFKSAVPQPIQRKWKPGRIIVLCAGGNKCAWVCICVNECINYVENCYVALTICMYLCYKYTDTGYGVLSKWKIWIGYFGVHAVDSQVFKSEKLSTVRCWLLKQK